MTNFLQKTHSGTRSHQLVHKARVLSSSQSTCSPTYLQWPKSPTRVFYANAYIVSPDVPKFVSDVRGKTISFEWKVIDRILKLKFKESWCKYGDNKGAMHRSWPYFEMLSKLAIPGRGWHGFTLSRDPDNI
ncbi:unnamed protein product [Vicia faba]|uniref:Uncharacterized protein n=1 Tax=Vicia faba TaxID=3906 RepID=A0AAV0YR29_VICFA|nr:unnamed protein product [Vicia faba]